ncbi:MAG: penicillin-binding protein 1C [Chitinophagales bacterium]|nr:penicillin-binding protein 1C [Bacteroidota bacterium]
MNKTLFKYLLVVGVLCVSLFFVLNIIFPFRVAISYSPVVYDHNGQLLYAFLSDDDKWRLKTELDEIIPELQKTIIYKEDKYFYWHFGVNPLAVTRAFFQNIFKNEVHSGASTISMQVVRMLNPQARSYKNKLIEMFRAMQLEWQYSKKEILQLYLNLVPYGGNIEGVKSASVLFLGKMPNQLSISEIATLSVVPNQPTIFRLKNSNTQLLEMRNRWLNIFEKAHLFEEKLLKAARREPLAFSRRKLPQFAPHFCYRMKKQYGRSTANIVTTLNAEKQTIAENIVHAHAQRNKNLGIYNAAVLVVDNSSNEVVCYVGSADFYNATDGGQVDGIQAVRQPGSTLKPLIYGMAFDEGLYTPATKIPDVAVNYSGYTPLNYDKTFQGWVRVSDALAQSLNVPAVNTLYHLGMDNFLDKMEEAGFSQITANRKKMGLSLALGACGVRLEELVRMYAAFAHEGVLPDLHYLQKENSEDSLSQPIKKVLLSSAAVYMLNDVLQQLTRPDLPNIYVEKSSMPKIAWKTGTSYGRRDAWSVGYNKHYTIGVWVGNFSGKGVPELTGANMAAPLLFDIFKAIDAENAKEWFLLPKGLQQRWVCVESGLLPDTFCTNKVADYFIPAVSTVKKCTHKKAFFVSPDEKYSYCASCLPDSGFVQKLYDNPLPEVLSFYMNQNVPISLPPPHLPSCTYYATTNGPKITSLQNGLEYLIDVADNNELTLAGDAAADVKKLYWFVNDRFVGEAAVGEQLYFEPPAGKVKISCADDKGRNTDIFVKITIF